MSEAGKGGGRGDAAVAARVYIYCLSEYFSSFFFSLLY